MAPTLVSLLMHLVFSTKHRADLIAPEIESELYAYLGGIAHNHGARLLAANGTTNHMHLLISQSKNMALSEFMAELKKSSSKWIKSRGREFTNFYWQDGYGAFSIGQSQVATVKAYIARQKEHHRKQTFETEFIAFLRKYEIEYEERYLWD